MQLRSFKALKQAPHCALNPFGQIPTYEEGDLTLFESGSILLRIGEHHPGLLPDDPDARSRAITWMFAALSTMEPPIVNREIMLLLRRGGLRRDGILAEYPNLEAYVARGEARPAYQRAFAAQHKVFEDAQAAGGNA